MSSKITFLDEADIQRKTVLLRADFDVSLNHDSTIADDARIRQNIPTIKLLLQNKNKLICVAKLGRPKERDPKFSLAIVVERLKEYLPENKITLVDDFLTADKEIFTKQENNEILVLENIRFYPEEKANDPEFAKKLSALADVYVNDAFAVSHRSEASIVGVPNYLPAYGGLRLKKEIFVILDSVMYPKKPVVAILGGAKISTKINLIGKLMEIADSLLIGGGLANTLLAAQGHAIGKSYIQADQIENAKKVLTLAAQYNTKLFLPEDVIVGQPDNIENGGQARKVEDIDPDEQMLDIGPETQAKYGALINNAGTVIWNGPVGYFENPLYRHGTDFIYYMITQNKTAVSIVGGGDTLAAISKKEYLEKITHISTGGGAMLELIEKGTLPGIEALKQPISAK